MKTVTFTYVRHGRTLFNRDDIIQGGRVDSPLDPEGIPTIQATGRALADVPFARCWSSPLQRVLDTAAIVLDGRDVPVTPLDDLREFDFGDIDGLPYQGNRLKFAKRFVMQDYASGGHGGEAGRDVRRRVRRAFETMYEAADDGDQVLVTAHGALFRYVLLEFSDLPYPLRKLRSETIKCPNASVSTVIGRDGDFELVTLPHRP